MSARNRFIGIDFSGGKEAGRHIYICAGKISGDQLVIESCYPAEALPNSASQRPKALAALQNWLASQHDAVVGLDFPFGLSRKMIASKRWSDFVNDFQRRFPTVEEFLKYCKNHPSPGEQKRMTDVVARAPFSPYNLRVFRQTYYGIRDVLAPLIQQKQAVVLPLQPLQEHLPILIEVCPASFLKKEGLYRPYKGKTEKHRQQRKHIIQILRHRYPISFSNKKLLHLLMENATADPLDAFLSALIAWQAFRNHFNLEKLPSIEYLLEGFIYF